MPEILKSLKREHRLTKREIAAALQPFIADRGLVDTRPHAWYALTYLKAEGLLSQPGRDIWEISHLGLEANLNEAQCKAIADKHQRRSPGTEPSVPTRAASSSRRNTDTEGQPKMGIDPTLLNRMYRVAGVDKEALHRALVSYGPAGVDPRYRDQWSTDNPTRGYCYVVTQFVLGLHSTPASVVPYELRGIPGEPLAHWFLKWDEEWVDLTAEQFQDSYGNMVNYSRAKPVPDKRKPEDRRAQRLRRLYEDALLERHQQQAAL